jgi:hypothetical protein
VNIAGLQAFFATHKTAVLGAGAAGVAGLALYQRKKGTATDGAGIAGSSPAAAVVQGSTAATGGGSYDSSAYDVYSAMQPQMEQLAQALADQTGGGAGSVSSAPKPSASSTTPSKPAPAKTYSTGYYRTAGTNMTYYQDSKGNLDWLSAAEGKALGFGGRNQPKVHLVPVDSTFWDNRKYLGTGPKPTLLPSSWKTPAPAKKK